MEPPSVVGALAVVDAVLPAARATDLQRRLAGITGGEGVIETSFEGYEPVLGEPPVRGGFGRTDGPH